MESLVNWRTVFVGRELWSGVSN